MDNSLISGLSAGGIGGVIIAVVFLLYKCLQGKQILSKCCGAELDIKNDKEAPTTVQIVTSPHTTPVVAPAPPPVEPRKMSVIELPPQTTPLERY